MAEKKKEAETQAATVAKAKAGVRFGAGRRNVLVLTDARPAKKKARP